MALEVAIRKHLENCILDAAFNCGPGEIMILTGPSGAGKTTLLRILAGLCTPDAGSVRLDGAILADCNTALHLRPHQRGIGYVFQDYTLFPHLSLEKNVLFGKADKEYGLYLLERMGMAHLRSKKPRNVSGGERQRSALAQVLARRPQALLLDEPFSALDREAKSKAHALLREYIREYAVPCLLVTHDLREAEAIGDTMYMLEYGKLNAMFLRCEQPTDAGREELPTAACPGDSRTTILHPTK